MRPVAKLNFKSLAKAEKNLQELKGKVERQLKREALRKASTPMRKAAALKAKKRSGALAKSLKVKVSTFKKSEIVIATIGPDRNARGEFEGKEVLPRNYAHLVEFGTENMPGSPYMRPAFDEKKNEAIQIYAKELKDGLPRVARRIYRKAL